MRFQHHLKHTYVPAFDGLRALVLVVIFTHLEGFSLVFETHHRLEISFSYLGNRRYSLNVFFALSGFLHYLAVVS